MWDGYKSSSFCDKISFNLCLSHIAFLLISDNSILVGWTIHGFIVTKNRVCGLFRLRHEQLIPQHSGSKTLAHRRTMEAVEVATYTEKEMVR